MDLSNLKQFLVKATRNTYAVSGEQGSKRQSDGSKTFTFTEGAFKENDNYFGGEPYGGRTVVYFKNEPVWMMVYYGNVDPQQNIEPTYRILQNALLKIPEEYPFRGPQEYSEDDYLYQNNWTGEIDNFSGEEKILYKDQQIYWAKYLGGLINLRKD